MLLIDIKAQLSMLISSLDFKLDYNLFQSAFENYNIGSYPGDLRVIVTCFLLCLLKDYDFFKFFTNVYFKSENFKKSEVLELNNLKYVAEFYQVDFEHKGYIKNDSNRQLIKKLDDIQNQIIHLVPVNTVKNAVIAKIKVHTMDHIEEVNCFKNNIRYDVPPLHSYKLKKYLRTTVIQENLDKNEIIKAYIQTRELDQIDISKAKRCYLSVKLDISFDEFVLAAKRCVTFGVWLCQEGLKKSLRKLFFSKNLCAKVFGSHFFWNQEQEDIAKSLNLNFKYFIVYLNKTIIFNDKKEMERHVKKMKKYKAQVNQNSKKKDFENKIKIKNIEVDFLKKYVLMSNTTISRTELIDMDKTELGVLFDVKYDINKKWYEQKREEILELNDEIYKEFATYFDNYPKTVYDVENLKIRLLNKYPDSVIYARIQKKREDERKAEQLKKYESMTKEEREEERLKTQVYVRMINILVEASNMKYLDIDHEILYKYVDRLKKPDPKYKEIDEKIAAYLEKVKQERNLTYEEPKAKEVIMKPVKKPVKKVVKKVIVPKIMTLDMIKEWVKNEKVSMGDEITDVWREDFLLNYKNKKSIYIIRDLQLRLAAYMKSNGFTAME
jgi:hypothetical protein